MSRSQKLRLLSPEVLKGSFFQKNNYSSAQNEAICDWNTGAEFVNPRRSYLTFKVKLSADSGTPTANFGHGGAANLIRRVVLTSRSGVELSRTEEYNLLVSKTMRYGCSRAHVQQFGELMGLNDDSSTLGQDDAQLSTTDRVFIIPLYQLSPFFAGDGKSLIPPQLAAGPRLQLSLEDDKRALVTTSAVAANNPKYEISEISVMTNVTTMVDSWQKQINEESARDGLTYSYPERHTTQSTLPTGQTRINIEVRKAVARAMLAFTVTQTDGATGGADYTKDNMKSDSYAASSVEYRLGSLYPTQQPVKSAEEMYYIAQSVWDSDVLDCKRTNAVSLQGFKTSTAAGASTGASDGDAVTATSLERNDVSINGVLNIGGLPTNNSRVLSTDITLGGSLGSPAQTYLFMKHLRVCKAYLDNVSISE